MKGTVVSRHLAAHPLDFSSDPCFVLSVLQTIFFDVTNSSSAIFQVLPPTLLSSCSRMMYMYAMRVLRAHGLPDTSLQDVFRAVVVSRIEYAAPAWSGMCSAADRARLDSLLRRSKRLGYCRIDQLEVANMFSAADEDFFSRIKSNSHHVLQPYLPDNNDIPYQLRARSHTLALINKTKFLNHADFIIRLLYKYSY